MDGLSEAALVRMQLSLNRRLRELRVISEAAYREADEILQTRLEKLHGVQAE